jgi:hypothetical protein
MSCIVLKVEMLYSISFNGVQVWSAFEVRGVDVRLARNRSLQEQTLGLLTTIFFKAA